jgi:hypothetical protein
MRVRLLRIVVFVLAGAAFALPVQADWLGGFFNGIARDVKRRQCWPKPFVCPDAEAAFAPFEVQVENGWKGQNTLEGYHFEPGSGRVTEAGRLKVEWIVIHAPEQHRAIYVERAGTAQETVVRIQAVQQVAAQVAPQGPAPPVLETTNVPGGMPGDQFDIMWQKYKRTIPTPRLPAVSQDTAGK